MGPGLHFKAPFGVDKHIIVKKEIIHREEFGFNSPQNDNRFRMRRNYYQKRDFNKESLMLTGDLNVANVEWDD